MKFKPFLFLSLGLTMVMAISSTAVQAQISAAAQQHAQNISKNCPGAWTTPACLKAVSASSYDMTIDYASKLESAGKKDFLEPLKQTCAASTAAREQDFPADAMNSAFKECANGIYDITQKSGVLPDRNYFQLIVVPSLCMDGAKECAQVEQQMRAMVKQ